MRLTTLGLPPYNIFTIEEIGDATNNFDPSNLIGEGSQGEVQEFEFHNYTVTNIHSYLTILILCH